MNYKHGFTTKEKRHKGNSQWRTYCIWIHLKSRCDNPQNGDYVNYGGRGITYDPAWYDFDMFIEDMGLPEPRMTIDRIDNDGPYCKTNCLWVEKSKQSRNRRSNHYLYHDNQYRTVTEWARHLGVRSGLLRVRLDRGWSVEDTLSRQPDETVGRFKKKAV